MIVRSQVLHFRGLFRPGDYGHNLGWGNIMSMQNKLSTLVAIALATTATSGFAITDDDEDSVRSWGPWATLVQPAAGPQTPTPTNLAGPVVPGFGSGDATSFTPTVITPTTPTVESTIQGRCTAGIACGYAFITQDVRQEEGSSRTSPQAATPVLNPIPTFVQVAPAPAPAPGFPGVISIVASATTSLTVNSITDIPLSESVLNQNVFFMGPFWFARSKDVSLSGVTVDVAGTPFAYGTSFRKGEEGSIQTSFIYGESTGLADLNALNVGNVQANYNGAMINSAFVNLSSVSQVAVAVDFGAATWSGSWNGGADSSGVTTSLSSDGVNVLSGRVGFNASGTISGANIVSTSVSASDASAISGTVNGSFFGGNAGVLAGAVDITKTVLPQPQVETQVSGPANQGIQAQTAYTDGVFRGLFATSTGDVRLPLAGGDN